jgi:hypothetical protein
MAAAASSDLQKVQSADLPLTDQANNIRRKRNRVKSKNIELEDFRRKYLGIDPTLSIDQRVGELNNSKTTGGSTHSDRITNYRLRPNIQRPYLHARGFIRNLTSLSL